MDLTQLIAIELATGQSLAGINLKKRGQCQKEVRLESSQRNMKRSALSFDLSRRDTRYICRSNLYRVCIKSSFANHQSIA